MKALFLKFLEVGFSGSVIIVLVLLLRLVLKRAPKSAICLLWGLVMLRLLCPFTVESALSLQPRFEPAFPLSGSVTPSDSSDLPSHGPDQPLITGEDLLPGNVVIPTAGNSGSREIDYAAIAAAVWLAGAAVMGAYCILSYLRLRHRVRGSIPMDGYLETSAVGTAFVLGFVKPRIYLPAGLPDQCRDHVLAHERSHITRRTTGSSCWASSPWRSTGTILWSGSAIFCCAGTSKWPAMPG